LCRPRGSLGLIPSPGKKEKEGKKDTKKERKRKKGGKGEGREGVGKT
jgi:hypothetical protein